MDVQNRDKRQKNNPQPTHWPLFQSWKQYDPVVRLKKFLVVSRFDLCYSGCTWDSLSQYFVVIILYQDYLHKAKKQRLLNRCFFALVRETFVPSSEYQILFAKQTPIACFSSLEEGLISLAGVGLRTKFFQI